MAPLSRDYGRRVELEGILEWITASTSQGHKSEYISPGEYQQCRLELFDKHLGQRRNLEAVPPSQRCAARRLETACGHDRLGRQPQ